ncbi:unnamed protein product [Effrenium voratum]|nr:unnamed protein product [Effrenium voratum]
MMCCCEAGSGDAVESIYALKPDPLREEGILGLDQTQESPRPPHSLAKGGKVIVTFERPDGSEKDVIFQYRPLGMDCSGQEPIVVQRVRLMSPADRAEVKVNWVVRAVDGIRTPGSLRLGDWVSTQELSRHGLNPLGHFHAHSRTAGEPQPHAMQGYVKLTDMGIAKMVTGKTFTVCGTADYFAPETLKQVGHNRAVDWWALGVMLFIMIAGHSPFDAPEVTQIYKNIIRGLSKVQFPAGFSPEAEECVRSLCRKKPEDRITMQRGGIQNLWALAFFNGMNWEAVQDQTWPPPFVPETDYDKISNRQLSRHVHIVWEGLQPWAPEAEEEPSQSWGSLAWKPTSRWLKACILVSPVTSIIMISACARRVALSARAVPAGAAANVSPLAAQTRLLHQSSPRFNQCVNPGYPVMWTLVYDKPAYDPEMELEYDVMPRDEFGVPAHIPPEISTAIRHTYYIPPQYYPFLKKLGDDTPELKPWMDKLINGEMTFDDYEVKWQDQEGDVFALSGTSELRGMALKRPLPNGRFQTSRQPGVSVGQRVPGEQRRGRAGDLSLGVAMIPRTAKGAKGKLKDVKLGKENFLECPRGRVQLSRPPPTSAHVGPLQVTNVACRQPLPANWPVAAVAPATQRQIGWSQERTLGLRVEQFPKASPARTGGILAYEFPLTMETEGGAKPSTTSPRKGFKSPAPGKNEGGYSKFDRKDYIPPPPVPATDEERAELEGMVARLQDYQVDELMDRFQGRTDETTQEVVIDIDRMNVDRRRQFRAEIERLLNEKDTVDTRSHASSPPGS